MTDGGPTGHPSPITLNFFLGRLWEDGLAPGQSRVNSIEHVWSSCSRWLTGVSLSPYLPGKSCVPAEQRIPADERNGGSVLNALESLITYCDVKWHDGFWITFEAISTSAEDSDND